MPGSGVGARISNESIVLEGIVPNAVAADRAVQIAESYAPGKVINLLSVGSSQQVMLEVRFSEVKRSALKDFGINLLVQGGGSHGFDGVSGPGAQVGNNGVNFGQPTIGPILGSFGVLTRRFGIFGLNFDAALNALESKGAITTLAEPTLVALSGETASFLAGGEFPIPVAQSGSTAGTGDIASTAITVEFKPFGVSLSFTPTVLADGVISLLVAPEVSSIDPTAAIVVNNLRIPGLQTRRAKTTVELRDGESFALAGLLRRDFSDTVRQFPILGSIPIIGTLFRSTSFQKDETELVIIVTPRLVRPVRRRGLGQELGGLRLGVGFKALEEVDRAAGAEEMREGELAAAGLAAERGGINLMEAPRPELDRMTNGLNHQGLVLQVPPYEYAHPEDLVANAHDEGQDPLIVALDGVTDPRNLGAVVRSVSAFGGHGVVVPERRAAGMTAGAWKTSAGTAARTPVARATNLTRALEAYKKAGIAVVGLAADGEAELGRDKLAVLVEIVAESAGHQRDGDEEAELGGRALVGAEQQ